MELINKYSRTDITTVELPDEAEIYALEGNGTLRSRTMLLNGKELVLGKDDELPELGAISASGKIDIAPGGCTFILTKER